MADTEIKQLKKPHAKREKPPKKEKKPETAKAPKKGSKSKKEPANKDATPKTPKPKRVKRVAKTTEEIKKIRADRKAKKLAGGKLPEVPETILKKRRLVAQRNAKRRASVLRAQRKKVLKKRIIFKRAEKYVMEYKKQVRDELRLRREAKKFGNFYVPAEQKIAFVIRIRGINGISPKARKVLQLFRLLQINNGVFVKLNGATVPMLRIIEPFITWGYPNLKSIRHLLYKRGFAKKDGQRKPLLSNGIIDKSLGKHDILCMEDIVHELFTCGSNFTRVSNFLWPFKLNTPTGGWRKKLNHYVEGGDFGCRETKINNLISKMC